RSSDLEVAETRPQVFVRDVPMIPLRRMLVHRHDIRLPLFEHRSKLHERPRRHLRVRGGADLHGEKACRFGARHLAQIFVAQRLANCAVGSDLELPPANCPPPLPLQKRAASVLPFPWSHTRQTLSSRRLFVGLPAADCSGWRKANHLSWHFLRSRKARIAAGSKRTYLPSRMCGIRSVREVPRDRVCSYTQLGLTFSRAATSSTVSSSCRSYASGASGP